MQQDPDQQRNLLLAVVLSMAVLLGWQYFYAGPKLEQEQARQRAQRELAQKQGDTPDAAKPSTAAPPPGAAVPGAGAAAPAPTVSREDSIKVSPRLTVETPSLKGSIALRGGRVDDLVLVKYHETVDPKSPNVVLFSPSDSPHPYFAEYGFIAPAGSSVKVPDGTTLWQTQVSGPLTPAAPVTLTWDNGQGVIFKRTISVDDDYMFKLVDEIENRSAAEISLTPYARVHRYGTPKTENNWILHEGLIGVADSSVDWCGWLFPSTLCEIKYQDALEGADHRFDSKAGWIGFTDKYWAATVIPNQGTAFRAQFSGHAPKLPSEQPSFQADYMLDTIKVGAGQTASIQSQLFAGAKQMQILQAYQDTGILKFDLLIDWGWFFFITKPLFRLMEAINSHVHNFGVTILILTVIVRLFFFPLANKQYASMAKMKKLQPQMEQLRERYKDDKVRQQSELMELYKREKVNPVAGCLPILLQIPVFFALYKVLYITIDMRHAPFFGWIKDLSAPDPTTVFNLFGLIPWDPSQVPVIGYLLMVGVWPLVMGATMWLQMQLNPQQPDPVQQQIFNWMPIVFTFLLAAFPAGLVIYWAWSNTLSLAQQYYIMRRQGADIHLMGNLSRQFKPVASMAGRGADAIKRRRNGKEKSE